MQTPQPAAPPPRSDETTPDRVAAIPTKRPFLAPKLTFVEPKLVRHGSLQGVTAQGGGTFFGSFSP